jgi:CheY-like chemotaxis protein
LDISKIESGKLELESIPFDMSELLSSCRALVLPKAIEKGLPLYFYAEPSVGKMPLGDPTRLRQIFTNLLSNSIKFSNTGMVKLQAILNNVGEESITMTFEVRDSGIGMTPEQIKQIFSPFTQGDTGTTRKYGGTGLGLTITKNIVELMGGQLKVDSAVGIGSKFSFELTFKTTSIEDGGALKKIVLSDLEKPVFEGEILICEDNLTNQQVICEHLARVGLRSVVADNGQIGVDKVKSRITSGEKQFDLIFMDMHMPVMDGLEAASKIMGLNTGIPIVAMTANIMSDDREIYKENGMNDCVGKPFTSAELWNCLMKYFTPVKVQVIDSAKQTQEENELWKKLIVNFVTQNKDKSAEIADAVDSGDFKLAHRLAHTLKGNAAQLGKVLLQKAAEGIEEALKDGGGSVTPRQLKTLDIELSAVLVELTPLYEEFSQIEESSDDASLSAESSLELLDKLAVLLEQGNPGCRDLIGELRRIPDSEELIQQISAFEFPEAIACVIELRKKIVDKG